MYTGEAIVHSKTLDEVMACGEFLRISGFSAKKASSMLQNRQGLVSVPLVTVTKTINMDATLQSDTRHDGSATPAPTTTRQQRQQPSTSQQQSQQPLQARTPQQQLQRDETLQQPDQLLLASQELQAPRKTTPQPKPQDDLMQPQELLDASQELLAPQGT
uniref:Uncharacterized protein n=1 Tax=Anopheles maculatus TaxID=74869 RepID=A0A182SZF2_9DIPT